MLGLRLQEAATYAKEATACVLLILFAYNKVLGTTVLRCDVLLPTVWSLTTALVLALERIMELHGRCRP